MDGVSLPHAQNNDPSGEGGKEDHYDGDQRVPLLVRWSAQIKADSSSDNAGLVFDLLLNFPGLAGGKPSPELDAVTLVPILKGGATARPRDLCFARREGGLGYGGKSYETIIRGDWKLLQNNPLSPLEPYHLKTARQEKKNLAATEKKMFNELASVLWQHIQRGGATPWQMPTP